MSLDQKKLDKILKLHQITIEILENKILNYDINNNVNVEFLKRDFKTRQIDYFKIHFDLIYNRYKYDMVRYSNTVENLISVWINYFTSEDLKILTSILLFL